MTKRNGGKESTKEIPKGSKCVIHGGAIDSAVPNIRLNATKPGDAEDVREVFVCPRCAVIITKYTEAMIESGLINVAPDTSPIARPGGGFFDKKDDGPAIVS